MNDTSRRHGDYGHCCDEVCTAIRETELEIAEWVQSLAPEFQCLRHQDHAEQGWAAECIAAALRRGERPT